MYYGKVTDKEGKPIVNAPLSDGRNITFTDEKGMYRLEGWEKSHTVCLCMLTEEHNDWFHYTDGKEGEYNFSVNPVKGEGEFSFLHTSDTEIHERDDIPWIEFAKATAEKYSPAFMVHTGDICRAPGLNKHYKVMNVDTVGVPCRYVIGNHDYCDGDYGEQLYEKLYGPVWCSFDYADVHFIVLCLGEGEKPKGYTLDEQWFWLKNDLEKCAKGKKIIVLEHDSAPDDYNFVISAPDFDIDLKKYNLIAWVYGHYHINYHHVNSGVHNICTTCPDCGGADSSAAGIRVISVGKDVTSKMVYDGLFENKADIPLWQIKLEGNIEYSSLELYENDIIAATISDSYPKKCGVYRIDSAHGNVIWFFETEDSVRNKLAISEDKIFAYDEKGNLYCIDAKNGNLVYKKHFSYAKPDFVRMGVLCVKDMLFTGKGNGLYALDKNSGEEIWHWHFYRGSNSAVMPVYDEETGILLNSNHWRFMVALDAKTGKELWQNNDILLWHRNSTPVIENGIAYTCSDGMIGKFDIRTGEILLKKKVPDCMNTVGTPTICGDVIYYPTAENGVYAFDKNNFEFISVYHASNAHLFTAPYVYDVGGVQMTECSPIVKDGTLIFGASDGKVYFYNTETAKTKKRIIVKGPVLTRPLLTEDSIIIADFLGNIYKYKNW